MKTNMVESDVHTQMNASFERLGIFLGGMRCGSTAINDYLKQHPEICVHTKKDNHFFSGDDNWKAGWDGYLEGWSHYDASQHLVAFESTTHYTKYPLYKDTASRIASAPYDLRLLYGVRGPIARIESHFIHNAGKGYYDPEDAEAREKLLRQAINVSNYELQMQQYERFFSPAQLLIIVTDELISSPSTVLAAVCEFLGVDPRFSFEQIPRRPRKFKHDHSRAKLTESERVTASEALREPTHRFEAAYQVTIWDGID